MSTITTVEIISEQFDAMMYVLFVLVIAQALTLFGVMIRWLK